MVHGIRSKSAPAATGSVTSADRPDVGRSLSESAEPPVQPRPRKRKASADSGSSSGRRWKRLATTVSDDRPAAALADKLFAAATPEFEAELGRIKSGDCDADEFFLESEPESDEASTAGPTATLVSLLIDRYRNASRSEATFAAERLGSAIGRISELLRACGASAHDDIESAASESGVVAARKLVNWAASMASADQAAAVRLLVPLLDTVWQNQVAWPRAGESETPHLVRALLKACRSTRTDDEAGAIYLEQAVRFLDHILMYPEAKAELTAVLNSLQTGRASPHGTAASTEGAS